MYFTSINRNGKEYIHYGEKSLNFFLKNIFFLSGDNDIYLIYNNEILIHLIENYKMLNIEIDTNEKNFQTLFLTITLNSKRVHIKHISMYIKIDIQYIYTKIYNAVYVNYMTLDKEDINGVFNYYSNNKNIFKSFLYCINNVFNEINFFWKHYNSLTKIAILLFKKKYNKYNLSFYIDECLYMKLKNFYFGGRCEIFNLKNKVYSDILCIDFKNMYTNILTEYYPHGTWRINNDVDKIKNSGFYYVVTTSNIKNPILPLKDIYGKTNYQNGTIEGLYWYEELLLFIEYGGIIDKIVYSIEFENYDMIFNEFANHCISERSDNDIIRKIIFKSLSNNFIGWFGGEDISKYRNIIYPIIVASRGRIKWYKLYQKLILEGNTLLYSDTDSFFISKIKNFTFDDLDKKLFNLNSYDFMFILNKKRYVLKTGNDTICIGINKKVNFDNICDMFSYSLKQPFISAQQ